MPDAALTQVETQSLIHERLRAQAQEMLKGYEGAATRMVYHSQLGLATAAEAKFARQYGWEEYRRY
ncbi:MAG: hypothetical protein Q8R30_04465 [bacterium]|nr:hypothetical protein [bacterium]